MNARTAAAVMAARPELRSLKSHEEQRPYLRRMGNNGDQKVKKLINGEMDDAIVIGFSIPVNIAAKAKKVVEIPIGSSVDRRILGDDLDQSQLEQVAKALAEFARIPLKAYITRTEALTTDAPAEEAEKEADFAF